MKSRTLSLLAVGLILGFGVGVAQAADSGMFGVSTLTRRLLGNGDAGFQMLVPKRGERYVVREGARKGLKLGAAQRGRSKRRISLAYFGQLTDFQLTDEESPARFEFLDPLGGRFLNAWRPTEALNAQEENAMIQQMNAFAGRAPNAAGDGSRRSMDFVVNTGDIADSQQYNEVLWNRELIEGDTVDPGSGVDPAASTGVKPLCPDPMPDMRDGDNPAGYTGVQDRDDWPGDREGYFYDPDNPAHFGGGPGSLTPFASAPAWPGLMNRAQQPFQAAGLDVPGYIVFGNHDILFQGRQWTTSLINKIATGCLKPVGDAKANGGHGTGTLRAVLQDRNFNTSDLLNLRAKHPHYFMEVPPDPQRRMISKQQFKAIFRDGTDPDGHGFGFVDPSQERASNGAAGYYDFSPHHGIRFIALDTTAEGTRKPPSGDGNLDAPQFRWFRKKLDRATAAGEIVIVFAHHSPDKLKSEVKDEAAPACSKVNALKVVGCDPDPRRSAPIKTEGDVIRLMHRHPNAIAWVAGHSHSNRVDPYPATGGGFWSIRTAALADWPRQNRLIEVFDNRDGTISIFGTVIDHAAPVSAPGPGTAANSMNELQLASVARVIGYNGNQAGGIQCETGPCAAGRRADRNVELLVNDPRARISKIRIRALRRSLRPGRSFSLLVRLSNGGSRATRRTRLKVVSSKRWVRVERVPSVGRIMPGAHRAVRLRLRAGNRARGKAAIAVRAGNLSTRTVLRIKAAR